MNRTPLTTEPRIDALKDFRRAITSMALAAVRQTNVADAATRLYGKNDVDVIGRAATALMSTSNTGALVGVRVGQFLRSIRPVSAAAQLFALSTPLDLTGVGSINLPAAFPDFFANNAMWVGEGGAAPVFRGSLAAVTVTPRKLMALSALTRELADYSAESAEAIITDGLERSVARALDLKLFSTDGATAVAPAGILNGITPVAGTAGGGVNALAGDLKSLIGAVIAAGGGSQLVVIASPVQAATLSVLGGDLALPVISAPSLAAGTVIVMDYGAFASAYSDNVNVEASDSVIVHLEDAAPSDTIGTPGTPNVESAPLRSAFQADLRVLKARLKAAWAMRAPAIAFTTTASW